MVRCDSANKEPDESIILPSMTIGIPTQLALADCGMIAKFLDPWSGDLSRRGKSLGITLPVTPHTGRFCGAKALALREAASNAIVLDVWRRLIDWECFEVWNAFAAVDVKSESKFLGHRSTLESQVTGFSGSNSDAIDLWHLYRAALL